MAKSTKIYFSHSFHDHDKPVVDAVRDVFNELRKTISFEDVSTAAATSQQLFNRLIGPMREVDIVVCIFTTRHHIAGPNASAFTAPPYVVSEAAAALALGKRLLVFVEKGIPREELGVTEAYNPQWQEIDRSRCGTTAYDRELRKSVEEALKYLVQHPLPSFTYELYEAQIALYPNGYILANQRLDVRALTGESIKHNCEFYPEDGALGQLPTASELYAIGKTNPCPFPTQPFTGFASSDPRAKLVPVDKPNAKDSTIREYRIELGGPGTYHYEWLWGAPRAFNPAREREWYWLAISQRAIERVRIVFRVHRLLQRAAEPRWTHVNPGRLDDGDPEDQHLKSLDDEAKKLSWDSVRQNPFFTCYELALNQIGRGYDLLLLF